MALPWMLNKNKNMAGLIIEQRKPDEGKEPESTEDSAMEAVASDIISAIESKDSKALAAALRSAFEISESEEEHEEPESEEMI